MSRSWNIQSKAWRDRLSALNNLPPVLKLLWESGRRAVLASVGFRLIGALLPVAALWVGKLIIDLVVAASKHPGELPREMWVLLAAEFTIASLAAILGRATDYYDGRLGDQFAREISIRVMDHAATLDLESFEDPVFYDKLERARCQTTDRIGLLNALGRLLQQVVTLVSLSTGVLLYTPWLFLPLIVSVVPAFFGESQFAFLGYALAYSLTPLRREMDYLRDLATKKEGAKELKVFGLGDFLRDRFVAINDEVIERNQHLARRRLRAGATLAIVGSLGYYGAYAFLVLQILKGELSIGDLTFLAGALAACSSQIQQMFSTFTGIADQALFLTDLIEFFAVKPMIVNAECPVPAPRSIRTGFEFQDVGFRYPGTDRVVLRNLNLHFEPGETIALVGENGQGKTTLVKLLSRFYEPVSGRILLDGIDLREYDLEDLRQQIGIIFQDFMRYDLSIRDNIAVGRTEYVNHDRRLIEAAQKSGALEILNRFPDGIDQMLGRRFASGVDLSGGEWQKFALARAYVRDAQVLILDEPTAALDAIAEYEVFRRFAELAAGRMAIIISHRFSTVRMSDRIVVLENGRIREQGTHDQLVHRGGTYAKMFELQAASYR